MIDTAQPLFLTRDELPEWTFSSPAAQGGPLALTIADHLFYPVTLISDWLDSLRMSPFDFIPPGGLGETLTHSLHLSISGEQFEFLYTSPEVKALQKLSAALHVRSTDIAAYIAHLSGTREHLILSNGAVCTGRLEDLPSDTRSWPSWLRGTDRDEN